MIGGIVTSTVMELAVFPAIYFLWRSRKIKAESVPEPTIAKPVTA
jgi:Cu(I)/Ag(I) efflux system membrane protein CusA/SilA